jgi:hypothetical protein
MKTKNKNTQVTENVTACKNNGEGNAVMKITLAIRDETELAGVSVQHKGARN